MTIFYWAMGVLIVGTFLPSALFLLLYAMTGNDVLARRARGFWDVTRVLTLFGFNILIWGHVIVGLWRIWFSDRARALPDSTRRSDDRVRPYDQTPRMHRCTITFSRRLEHETPVGETSSRADALRTVPMRWIKSPAWDLVWILNALWLAPLVLLLARGHDDVRASPVDGLFFALTVPLWFGHRVSSAWLAYATPAYRPLLAKQRLRFVVAPLAIAVACFAVLLAPESVLPMPLTERVVWLAVLDYLLVSYHFAAQHFGLLSLYRARAGRASEAITRRLDRWFALVVGGGFVVLAEALAGSIAFQDRWIDPLLGAVGADLFARTLRDGGIVLVVILTALMLRVELRSQRPSLPRVAYVLGVSAMVLFAFLARDPFLFIVLWSVQHWSAAMGLASLAASGGTQAPAHALAAAAGAHQPARLGSAARARRRLHACCCRCWRWRPWPTNTSTPTASSAMRRGGCAPRPSCRRCWPWASRPASSTTCWIALPSASPRPT